MARTVNLQGSITGDKFEIRLDGISTYEQTQAMLSKLDALVKRFKAEEYDNKALLEAKDKEVEKTKDLNKNLESLDLATSLLRGNFKTLYTDAERNGSSAMRLVGAASAGIFTAIGALTQYSAQLGQAIQRGISGDIMDFAVASKTAGLTLAQFNKALAESDGSFVALGGGATASAKQFGLLIGKVREATAATGNLGLNNEEQSIFVAKQLKIAASQGLKGQQAQAAVISASQNVGTSFIKLAEATGRSVSEMIAAASKLSLDPVVTSFVRSAGMAGQQLSNEVQKLAGSFRAIFGEAGDKIAEDLVKSTAGNITFALTKSGQELSQISGVVYAEMERQANIIRNGGQLTESDQQRLRDLTMEEVRLRGDELRTLATMEGPLQNAANQILTMAQAAQQMNDMDTVEARRRSENARKFNHSVNELQASLQEAMIPFLQVLSTINFTALFETLSALAQGFRLLLFPIELIGEIIGSSTIGGTVIGGLIALAAVILPLVITYKNLQRIFPNAMNRATEAAIRFAQALDSKTGNRVSRAGRYVGGLPGRFKEAAKTSHMGAGTIVGSMVGLGTIDPSESLLSNVAGAGLSMAGGAVGGALAGRLIGGLLGGPAGPVGIAIGSTLGGMAGAAIADYFTSGSELPGAAANAIDAASSATSDPYGPKIVGALEDLNSKFTASLGIQARGTAAMDRTAQAVSEQSIYTG